MFKNVFQSSSVMTDAEILICILVSLLCGIIIAAAYSRDKKSSKNLIVALVVLPIIVQSVIMMVNGNLGVGVAVMGAFSLVRFRSLPGSAKEIVIIFLAMAAGLACGVGCLYFALIMTIIICAVILILQKILQSSRKNNERHLKVVIPENLDYSGIFDDIFAQYTSYSELIHVKTVDMGTLYEVQYSIILNNMSDEKKMIDEIRCRNGNLTVICGKVDDGSNLL